MKALLFCVLLSACGGSVNEPENTALILAVPDPSPSDTGTITDSLNDTAEVSSSCIIKKEMPSIYPRLIERWCQNKDGVWFLNDYLDNQLNIGCRWNKTSDNVVRCTTKFYQSSWVFADNKCTVALAMIENEPYVGLNKDGMIRVFFTGKKFLGMNSYSLTLMGSDWTCGESFLGFPGSQSVYVGDEVDPSIFQMQN